MRTNTPLITFVTLEGLPSVNLKIPPPENQQAVKKETSAQRNSSLQSLQASMLFIKGSLDEKLPIYERDPKSKRIDSFDNRFVRE